MLLKMRLDREGLVLLQPVDDRRSIRAVGGRLYKATGRLAIVECPDGTDLQGLPDAVVEYDTDIRTLAGEIPTQGRDNTPYFWFTIRQVVTEPDYDMTLSKQLSDTYPENEVGG